MTEANTLEKATVGEIVDNSKPPLALLMAAEQAIDHVPVTCELVGYQSFGPRSLNSYAWLRHFAKQNGISVKAAFSAMQEYLPGDLVYFDNPIDDSLNVLASGSINNRPTGPRAQRFEEARSKVAALNGQLANRAQFVAAVVADRLELEGTREFHEKKIDPESDYARFRYKNAAEQPLGAEMNDTLLLDALFTPTALGNWELAQFVAGEIKNPELSLIAFSGLYTAGDIDSFEALLTQANQVFLGDHVSPSQFVGGGRLRAVSDFLTSLAERAVDMDKPDHAQALRLLHADFLLNTLRQPGTLLFQYLDLGVEL